MSPSVEENLLLAVTWHQQATVLASPWVLGVGALLVTAWQLRRKRALLTHTRFAFVMALLYGFVQAYPDMLNKYAELGADTVHALALHSSMAPLGLAMLLCALPWRAPHRGTQSLLWGVHHVFLHPLFVLIAWTRLYGFPKDPRVHLAILVHDLGYWGKQDVDGVQGERHPYAGARFMGLFGPQWADFTRLHSRKQAEGEGRTPSRLCAADKLAFVLEPRALYMPRAVLSGEAGEFLERAGETRTLAGLKRWHAEATRECRGWVEEHAQTLVPPPGGKPAKGVLR